MELMLQQSVEFLQVESPCRGIRINAMLLKPASSVTVPALNNFARHGIVGSKRNETDDSSLRPVWQLSIKNCRWFVWIEKVKFHWFAAPNHSESDVFHGSRHSPSDEARVFYPVDFIINHRCRRIAFHHSESDVYYSHTNRRHCRYATTFTTSPSTLAGKGKLNSSPNAVINPVYCSESPYASGKL